MGNWLGGRLADRSIDGTLLGFLVALTVVLVLFALLAASPVATIVLLFLMGGFGFGTVPGLQTRIMGYADGAPTLASSANIAAFNLGNALGAFARRPGHHGRPRLHLPALGRRRHHRRRRGRDGRRRRRCPARDAQNG